MALTDYSPNDTFPDLDGSGGDGPLQLPQKGDPYTFDAMLLSTSITNPSEYKKHGVQAKVLDALTFLKNRLYGSSAQPGVTNITKLCGVPVWSESGWQAEVGGSAGSDQLHWVNLTAGKVISFHIDVPLGVTLVSASLNIYGAQGHSAFPGGAPQHMPVLDVLKIDSAGTATSILTSPLTDPASTVGTYETKHALSVNFPANTTTSGSYTYWIALTPEYGTNSIANSSNGTWAYGASVTYK